MAEACLVQRALARANARRVMSGTDASLRHLESTVSSVLVRFGYSPEHIALGPTGRLVRRPPRAPWGGSRAWTQDSQLQAALSDL